MTRDGVQVLGLCRWSYPSELKAFQRHFESAEALRAYLYSAERMALRLFFLEHMILPCLKAQTDPDFTLLLMMGEGLPEPWRDEVMRRIVNVPQIHPVFLPEGQNHRRTVRTLMQEARDPEAKAVLEFRLDDDDAVAASFVADIRTALGSLHCLLDAHDRFAIDYCRGLVLHALGRNLSFSPVVARLWTPALAIGLRPDDPGSLLDYPHAKLWRRMPVVALPDPPMFLRGAHGDNDSELSDRTIPGEASGYDMTRLPKLLKRRFGIDLEAMDAAWTARLKR